MRHVLRPILNLHAASPTLAIMLLLGSVIVFPAAALAETAAFNATINNEARSASVNVVLADGQKCASLKELARQFGGQFKVSSGSVQVSLAGATATITVGETQVASSRNEFTLEKPAREVDNDIVIALNDVPGFFSYGFGLEVKSGAAAPASATGANPAPADGKKVHVVLDPGHGGIDVGKTSPNGTQEKALTLSIAQRVSKLIEQNCSPQLTRTGDAAMTTVDRVNAANTALKGNLLVSIHAGVSLSPTPSGFEIFCPAPDASQDPQARALVDRSLALGRSLANAVGQSTGTPVRGVRRAPCKIFKNLQMPAVLVEVGFLTNPAEEQLLTNAEYQQKLAQGIANGIAAYLSAGTQ